MPRDLPRAGLNPANTSSLPGAASVVNAKPSPGVVQQQNPELNPNGQVEQTVQTPQGPVQVRYQQRVGGSGTAEYVPVGLANAPTFTVPVSANDNVGGNASVQYTYAIQGQQLAPQATAASGEVTQKVYGTVSGRSNTYLGTIVYEPVVANGNVQLSYSRFEPTSVEVAGSYGVASGGKSYTIGYSYPAQTGYNASTGQVSLGGSPLYATSAGYAPLPTSNLFLTSQSIPITPNIGLQYNVSTSPFSQPQVQYLGLSYKGSAPQQQLQFFSNTGPLTQTTTYALGSGGAVTQSTTYSSGAALSPPMAVAAQNATPTSTTVSSTPYSFNVANLAPSAVQQLQASQPTQSTATRQFYAQGGKILGQPENEVFKFALGTTALTSAASAAGIGAGIVVGTAGATIIGTTVPSFTALAIGSAIGEGTSLALSTASIYASENRFINPLEAAQSITFGGITGGGTAGVTRTATSFVIQFGKLLGGSAAFGAGTSVLQNALGTSGTPIPQSTLVFDQLGRPYAEISPQLQSASQAQTQPGVQTGISYTSTALDTYLSVAARGALEATSFGAKYGGLISTGTLILGETTSAFAPSVASKFANPVGQFVVKTAFGASFGFAGATLSGESQKNVLFSTAIGGALGGSGEFVKGVKAQVFPRASITNLVEGPTSIQVRQPEATGATGAVRFRIPETTYAEALTSMGAKPQPFVENLQESAFGAKVVSTPSYQVAFSEGRIGYAVNPSAAPEVQAEAYRQIYGEVSSRLYPNRVMAPALAAGAPLTEVAQTEQYTVGFKSLTPFAAKQGFINVEATATTQMGTLPSGEAVGGSEVFVEGTVTSTATSPLRGALSTLTGGRIPRYYTTEINKGAFTIEPRGQLLVTESVGTGENPTRTLIGRSIVPEAGALSRSGEATGTFAVTDVGMTELGRQYTGISTFTTERNALPLTITEVSRFRPFTSEESQSIQSLSKTKERSIADISISQNIGTSSAEVKVTPPRISALEKIKQIGVNPLAKDFIAPKNKYGFSYISSFPIAEESPSIGPHSEIRRLSSGYTYGLTEKGEVIPLSRLPSSSSSYLLDKTDYPRSEIRHTASGYTYGVTPEGSIVPIRNIPNTATLIETESTTYPSSEIRRTSGGYVYGVTSEGRIVPIQMPIEMQIESIASSTESQIPFSEIRTTISGYKYGLTLEGHVIPLFKPRGLIIESQPREEITKSYPLSEIRTTKGGYKYGLTLPSGVVTPLKIPEGMILKSQSTELESSENYPHSEIRRTTSGYTYGLTPEGRVIPLKVSQGLKTESTGSSETALSGSAQFHVSSDRSNYLRSNSELEIPRFQPRVLLGRSITPEIFQELNNLPKASQGFRQFGFVGLSSQFGRGFAQSGLTGITQRSNQPQTFRQPQINVPTVSQGTSQNTPQTTRSPTALKPFTTIRPVTGLTPAYTPTQTLRTPQTTRETTKTPQTTKTTTTTPSPQPNPAIPMTPFEDTFKGFFTREGQGKKKKRTERATRRLIPSFHYTPDITARFFGITKTVRRNSPEARLYRDIGVARPLVEISKPEKRKKTREKIPQSFTEKLTGTQRYRKITPPRRKGRVERGLFG